ncbi:glutathione S-transferase family protein [Paracoccus sp. (in: a-proteobacteria)]|uniref:glutathione S-transferase family protein n=1 Tax=Paracoccus sp. TaxID=267 RepID=UPI0026E0C90F|nr:glutathione S-transferase family protein [Paracoccus sp. (in: a-proteobacteria)]MDO5648626.1 glutathione S-transferase family protein [Paracoccus sp. (in: a-proteobacteria)]
MGQLVNGEWRNEWYDTDAADGEFVRDTSKFRNWVTPDGAAGPSGDDGFPAESGRYHLYVSHACPWAHRTLIFRALKGLTDHITMSAVHPDMLDDGWTFKRDDDGATGDDLFGYDFLRQVYLRAKPDASGRVTVPILWDKTRDTIVSNESADIIRMFNSAFDGLTGNDRDFYPEPLRDAINALNDRIYDTVNNGVYKAGFATTQAAYDKAIHPLFDSLDWIEGILSRHRYLTGDQLTEADIRLFTTILRFDAVYHTHFKCNRARIVDYPNLWAWARDVYQTPGVADTIHWSHITRHYYYSHDTVNPHRIVPIGPVLDWSEPHGRG